MNTSTQLLKGLLEGCILMIIAADETYGYQICEDLSKGGFENTGEGTVYPILIRLEKKGLIQADIRKSPLGPKRKYFSLTEEGREYLNIFKSEWRHTQAAVNTFITKNEERKNETES